MIGPFRQWQQLRLWVSDSLKLPNAQRETLYPLNSSSEIADDYGGYLDFQLPPVSPADTIDTKMSWGIEVLRNDALAALPPPEMLAYFGNPFTASEEIEIPADGTVYMMISDVNSTVNVDLYMDTPENKLLLENVRSHFGDIVEFGPKRAGDKLRFYIRSDHTLVSGYQLYPNTYSSAVLNYDLSIIFKRLDFEDWTDLLFDDVICSLYLIPDHYGDFPWPMQVQLSPSVVAPGDTADIILRRRNADGSLEAFPDSVNFDVQVMENWDYGTIYSHEIGDTADFFYGIPGGFRFIARDSIDVDSVFVPIMVNTSGGIIAGSAQRPGAGTDIRLARKHKGNIEKNNTMWPQNTKENRQPPQDRRSSSSAELITPDEQVSFSSAGLQLNQDVSPEDFAYGIGEVLITQKEDSLDHFEIKIIPDTLAEKDTLAFAETAKLIIQAKDADSNNVQLQSDKLLRFKIEINEDFGTFINAAGDTLRTTPVVLSDIRYGDANGGLIKFAAVKENPDSVVKCLIKVTLQEDITKKGEREAIVLEQTLRIEMQAPLEVEPIITAQRYDSNSRAYLGAITTENRKEFRVRITRGGNILGGHKFKLSTNYMDSTGGHDHTTPRRPNEADNANSAERLKRQNYGCFYSYRSGPIFSIDSIRSNIIEETVRNAVSRFEYISSIWGDSMIIFLESMNNRLLRKDSIKIMETIPGLQLLPDDVYYQKIGGRVEHHGPPGYEDDHNHYGIRQTIDAMQNIAENFHIQFPQQQILIINDMSLPYGGKFDVLGQWAGSHVNHRTGRNVDVRSWAMQGDRYLDANSNGVYDPNPTDNPGERLLIDENANGIYEGGMAEDFRDICENNGATGVLLENPANHNGSTEHWHISF
ncbi:MAG: hypothetical protein P8184_19950 [Calditrichia bacterium]